MDCGLAATIPSSLRPSDKVSVEQCMGRHTAIDIALHCKWVFTPRLFMSALCSRVHSPPLTHSFLARWGCLAGRRPSWRQNHQSERNARHSVGPQKRCRPNPAMWPIRWFDSARREESATSQHSSDDAYHGTTGCPRAHATGVRGEQS